MLAFGAGLLVTMFAAKTCAKRKGEPTSQPSDAPKSRPTTTSAPTTASAPTTTSAPTTGRATSRSTTRKAPPALSNDKKDDEPKRPSHEGKPDNTNLYLGSLDPKDGYTFQVQFNTNGASIYTVKLSSHYATVEDKRFVDEFGYDRYVEALAKGDNKALKGQCSLMNPVSYDGATYYPLATRNVKVTLPDGTIYRYRHDPQLRSKSYRNTYGAWRAWKVLTEAQAKERDLGSTDDVQRLSFSWAFEHKAGPDAKYQPAIWLIKTYSVRKKDYTIRVSLRVENPLKGDKPLKVEIDQAGPTGVPREDSRGDMRKIAYGKYDDDKVVVSAEQRKDKLEELKLGSRVNVGDSSDDSVLWIGQTNKFFGCMLHLRPKQGDDDEIRAPLWKAEYYHQDIQENSTSGTQMTGVNFPEIEVESGAKETVEFELFAGPKRIDMFEDEDDEFHKPRYKTLAYQDTLDLSSCFCAWDWLSLFVVGFLGTLAKHVTFGNYGLAIFLLVVIVRLCLHPLTKKGQVMMSKMKKFQPMIKELEKKYADDKEALNRERIKLFREHGANPLLGCLPMLLQMPILIALWRGISATTDLRHAAFLPVWIVDLAAPDKLFPFGVDLPLIGGYLNLMPLLLGAAMYWQMKLSPQSPGASSPDQEKQQKMMQMMFPIMMPVMFYHMASGLTLYFLASTFFGAAESHYIRKHIEAREALEAAITTTVHMPGKRSRSSRPKKPKGPNWFKQN